MMEDKQDITMGGLFLSIDQLSKPEIRKALVDVNGIFQKDSPAREKMISELNDSPKSPAATKGALRKNLLRGVLGFWAGTKDYAQLWDFRFWNKDLYEWVNARLGDVGKLRNNWEDCLEKGGDVEQGISEIQELADQFAKDICKCLRDPEKEFPIDTWECWLCELGKDCIRNVTYGAKRRTIEEGQTLKEKGRKVTAWLTDVYDFSSFLEDDKVRDKLQECFDLLYQEKWIPLCREKNARVLAGRLPRDSVKFSEILEAVQTYISDFDSQLWEDDEQIAFEQMVFQAISERDSQLSEAQV